MLITWLQDKMVNYRGQHSKRLINIKNEINALF